MIVNSATEPAALRSPAASWIRSVAELGPVTTVVSTGVRMETFASDFALRIFDKTIPASLSTVASPSCAAASSSVVGQALVCTKPSCHHDHTSSVTNGRNGANRRSCTESASAKVAFADAAASGPRAPCARSLMSSM